MSERAREMHGERATRTEHGGACMHGQCVSMRWRLKLACLGERMDHGEDTGLAWLGAAALMGEPGRQTMGCHSTGTVACGPTGPNLQRRTERRETARRRARERSAGAGGTGDPGVLYIAQSAFSFSKIYKPGPGASAQPCTTPRATRSLTSWVIVWVCGPWSPCRVLSLIVSLSASQSTMLSWPRRPPESRRARSQSRPCCAQRARRWP